MASDANLIKLKHSLSQNNDISEDIINEAVDILNTVLTTAARKAFLVKKKWKIKIVRVMIIGKNGTINHVRGIEIHLDNVVKTYLRTHLTNDYLIIFYKPEMNIKGCVEKRENIIVILLSLSYCG